MLHTHTHTHHLMYCTLSICRVFQFTVVAISAQEGRAVSAVDIEQNWSSGPDG